MITTNKTLPSLILLLLIGFALSGCESGASDSDGDSSSPVGNAATINASNAGVLAGTTLLALEGSGGAAGAMNVAETLGAVCVTGTATPAGTGLDDLMLTVGESFGMDFDNCIDATGLTLDGSVTYTATAITGMFLDLINDWSTTFDVTFTGFTATQNGQTENLDDTYTLMFSFDAMTQEFTVSLDGETVVFAGGNVTFDDLSYEEMGGNFELSMGASLSIDGQSGTLGLVTVQPLVGPIAGAPESGAVLLTADDNSTLTMTFTGGGAVTVEIDEDGGGLPDCSQDLTFDTLDQFDPALCN
ncbi:MAG: hypothetical protein OEN20_02610 [Gammaproteobacteria bacterium]|nr:hypothetical protein [Gammaproteobacteria bacterium]